MKPGVVMSSWCEALIGKAAVERTETRLQRRDPDTEGAPGSGRSDRGRLAAGAGPPLALVHGLHPGHRHLVTLGHQL